MFKGQKVKEDLMALEADTTALSRNFGNRLPSNVILYPRRMKPSAISLQKPSNDRSSVELSRNMQQKMLQPNVTFEFNSSEGQTKSVHDRHLKIYKLESAKCIF
jgi:hypothetical protein